MRKKQKWAKAMYRNRVASQDYAEYGEMNDISSLAALYLPLTAIMKAAAVCFLSQLEK